MKIGDFESHPAADVFPMIEGEEFERLVEDVRANGLKSDVVYVTEGGQRRILDGRNRLKACIRARVKATFTAYTGKDPEGFVASMNAHRRHMTPGQLAMATAELEAMRDVRHGGSRRHVASCTQVRETRGGLAAKTGASERSVARAHVVVEHAAPEIKRAAKEGRIDVATAAELARKPRAEQVEIAKELKLDKGGKATGGHARAVARQKEKRTIAAKIDAQRTPLMLGPYRVIVADPSWSYDNNDSHTGSRGHTPYPSMSTDSICALGPEVQRVAHPDGCVLWLWCTNAHLVSGEASRVAIAWGFRPITLLTWKKNKLGLGSWLRNQTEHAILAIRGKPTITLTNEATWFEADVREHSRKPDHFFYLVEKLCPGERLEMFARESRKGWARWGAEQDKFEAAG